MREERAAAIRGRGDAGRSGGPGLCTGALLGCAWRGMPARAGFPGAGLNSVPQVRIFARACVRALTARGAGQGEAAPRHFRPQARLL